MSHLRLIVIVVLALFALSLPAKADDKASFETSLEDWKQAKSANENSYEFTHSFSSVFNFSSKTVLTVRNGGVVSRKFYSKNQGEEVESLVYEETGTALNTHQRGFPAINLDTVYAICRSDVIDADQTNRKVYFKTNDMGILSTCGYRHTRCADDCFIGASITAFRWLDD